MRKIIFTFDANKEAMKRVFILLISILMIRQTAISQIKKPVSDKDRKGYIGINFGPSLPISDYASNDFNNAESGFANTGGNVNISFGYRLGTKFGISALLFGNVHPFDEKSFGFPNAPIGTSLDADAWRNGGVLAGGYYTSNSGRVSFEARIMFGYMQSILPALSLTYFDGNNDPVNLFEEDVSSGGFAGDAGIGVKVSISEIISFISHLDFLAAQPKYKNVATYLNGLLYDVSDYEQPIQVLNLSIGIAVNIK